jgi:hypothetical protein
LTGVDARRAVLILALLILVVEGYFGYRWYDRYSGSGSAPDTASGGAAPLEVTMPDRTPPDGTPPNGTAPDGTTAGRDVSSGAAGAAADRSADAAQRAEAEYVDAVADIQSGAVETFLESHEKLLRYDALATADVREMEANETALQGMADRAANLDPPRKYEEQHDVFSAAIDEMRNAAGLAHDMAADPVAAAELGFDEYDGRVKEASDLLRRSNELLGEDNKAIEGVREVSPEF